MYIPRKKWQKIEKMLSKKFIKNEFGFSFKGGDNQLHSYIFLSLCLRHSFDSNILKNRFSDMEERIMFFKTVDFENCGCTGDCPIHAVSWDYYNGVISDFHFYWKNQIPRLSVQTLRETQDVYDFWTN